MTGPAKKHLIVINDGPYGCEKPHNALRLALGLIKQPETNVRVFLLGDDVQCAIPGQETHAGYYNIERMMSAVVRRGEVAT